MKPDLIIHVGSPKTGTTSIQRSLDRVAHSGDCKTLHIPLSFGYRDGQHCGLGSCLRDPFYSQFVDLSANDYHDMINEARKAYAVIDSGRIRRIIFSDESLFYCQSYVYAKYLVEELMSIFESSSVQIVMYLPRPDKLVRGLYATALSRGNCEDSYQVFLEKTSTQSLLRYRDRINAWTNISRDCSLRLFPVSGEFDVASHFWREFVQDHLDTTEFSSPSYLRENQSLATDQLAIAMQASINFKSSRYSEFIDIFKPSLYYALLCSQFSIPLENVQASAMGPLLDSLGYQEFYADAFDQCTELANSFGPLFGNCPNEYEAEQHRRLLLITSEESKDQRLAQLADLVSSLAQNLISTLTTRGDAALACDELNYSTPPPSLQKFSQGKTPDAEQKSCDSLNQVFVKLGKVRSHISVNYSP